MPGVTASWTPVAWIAQINTPAVRFVSLSGGPDHPPGLAEPVVIKGRAPRRRGRRRDPRQRARRREPGPARRRRDDPAPAAGPGDRPVLAGVRTARRRVRPGAGGRHHPRPDLGRAGHRRDRDPGVRPRARRRRLVPRRVRPAAVHGPGDPRRLRRGAGRRLRRRPLPLAAGRPAAPAAGVPDLRRRPDRARRTGRPARGTGRVRRRRGAGRAAGRRAGAAAPPRRPPPRPAHRARARDDPGRARGGAGAGRRGRERSPRASPAAVVALASGLDRASGQPGPVRADPGVPGAVGGRAGRRCRGSRCCSAR